MRIPSFPIGESAGDKPQPARRRLALILKDVRREGEESLDMVFEKALRLINRIGLRPGEPDNETNPEIYGPLARKPFYDAPWLARVAIRAAPNIIPFPGREESA